MSTPLMRQYDEIKAQNPDSILFFRMGDFFELFGEDAVVASKVLGITLTTRNNGEAAKTELCGFPHHSAERYVPKMVAAGYKVAICEQLEDPKLAKGIVKRGVVEVITAGTAMSESNLEAKTEQYLCALVPADRNDAANGSGMWALGALDVTTGRFTVSQASAGDVECELYRLLPREVLYARDAEQPAFLKEYRETENPRLSLLEKHWFAAEECAEALTSHFGVPDLSVLGLDGLPAAVIGAGTTLRYAQDLKKGNLEHILRLSVIPLGDSMTLDAATLRNLEIVRPLNSEDASSTLFRVVDQTVTAMGGRLLKRWLSHPLLSVERIAERQQSVGCLFESPDLLDGMRLQLREVQDMERLLGRIGSGRANARDLQGLGKSLVKASAAGAQAGQLGIGLFPSLALALEGLSGHGEHVLSMLQDDLPMTVREGGMIRAGADEELDRLNGDIRGAREWLSGLETREKERLGIPNLKVGFNKVFGYFIEVSQSHIAKVPTDYIRKQTLAGCERYITPEMKDYETLILGAETRIHEHEYRIFCALRDEVNSWRARLLAAAEAVATLDVLQSLAGAARKHKHVCPQVVDGDSLEILGGRHPVIEAVNPDMEFVPNDISLQRNACRVMLITGPNMAGKSTYLRQTGLIVLLAQVGAFVPADSARIGLVDRIFTRVGASDRLSRGQSTFMVEMVETAGILRNATPRSLVLLDEIGRGTSTFDGLSLAWAVLEALHSDPVRAARTLFATHYHELVGLAEELPEAGNYQVAVKEKAGKLLFLRRIVEGACDSSYGIHVAEMAGLPSEVVERAKRILVRLERHEIDPSDTRAKAEQKKKPQVDMFGPPDEDTQLLIAEMRRCDPDGMTPLQALQFLSDAKRKYLR